MATQLDRIEQKLNRLAGLMRVNLQGDEIIMAELDDLKAQVARNTDVEDSALLLIQGIAAKLAAAIAAGDPAALKELETQLKTSADALAAAVAANTTPTP